MKREYVDRPTSNDIVFQSNGKEEMKQQHLGNKRFRQILKARLADFERNPSKLKEIVSCLFLEMQTEHPPIRFLRRDSKVGKFYLLRPLEAMTNIQQALVAMVVEEGQQNKKWNTLGRGTPRLRTNGRVLGEIDPNRIVGLTNDKSNGEQKKKELYSPKLASSDSKLLSGSKSTTIPASMDMEGCGDTEDESTGAKRNSHPVLTNDAATKIATTKSAESHSTEISLIYIDEEDLLHNDILYVEGDPVQVEIGHDQFQRVLIANFEDYRENRDDPFSQKQFQMKCLQDLQGEDPLVRFLRYDGKVEKYLEWDSSEALDKIRQAMEERLSSRANEQKSLADSIGGSKTSKPIQKETAVGRNLTTSPSPKGLSPSVVPTPANKPGEPIASTKTLPSQVVAITSSQENNELGLEADSSLLPSEAFATLLQSSGKVGTSGPGVMSLTTMAANLPKEADDSGPRGIKEEKTLHDWSQPHDHQSCECTLTPST